MRFASVYRKFEDVAEFEAELERLEAEPPSKRSTSLHDLQTRSVRMQVKLRSYPESRAKALLSGSKVQVSKEREKSI